MPRSSSRHKREIQGTDSAGQTAPEFGEKPNIGTPPEWTLVPNSSSSAGALPATVTLSTYVLPTPYGPLRDWTIVTDDPTHITVDQTGTVTFAAGLPVGTHICRGFVSNIAGATGSNEFLFEVFP